MATKSKMGQAANAVGVIKGLSLIVSKTAKRLGDLDVDHRDRGQSGQSHLPTAAALQCEESNICTFHEIQQKIYIKVKGKVKSFLHLIDQALRHKGAWRSGGIALRFLRILTSAIDESER
jgi:hypothetical protein